MKTARPRKKLILILFVLSLILTLKMSALMLIEVEKSLEKDVTEDTGIEEQEKVKPIFTIKPLFSHINLNGENETTISKEEEEIVHDQEFIDRCRLTFAESGGEPILGQIAVAAVIINREQSSQYPDDFYGVMNQKYQFSPVWDGEIHVPGKNGYVVLDYEKVPDKTIEAVERALRGEDPTEQLLWEEALRLGLEPEKYAAGGALYFYNPKWCSEKELAAREKIQVKVRIGNHIFYKVWG